MNTTFNPSRTAQGQYSLGREFYVDGELFAREREIIFARSWILLGRDDQWNAARAFCATEIGGQPIVVLRGDDHRLRGFHNVCRHRGATLLSQGKGCLEKEAITCPYHAWSYDLNGKLVGAPNMAGVESFARDQHGLRPIRVESHEGFVFAHGGAPDKQLTEFLAPVAAHLRRSGAQDLVLARSIAYDVHANWKLIFENYSECYHCPTVHPALNRLTPYRGASNESHDGPILGGPMGLADGIESMSISGRRAGCWLPGLSAEDRRAVFYFTVFPSCFLSFHPDYLLVHRLVPQAVDRTQVVCEFLFHADSAAQPGFDPREVVEFWDLTNRQDWEVCERVQEGARSTAFAPGPLSDLESVVAAFDRHYRQALGR